VRAELFHADRRTDRQIRHDEAKFALRNFANAPKNGKRLAGAMWKITYTNTHTHTHTHTRNTYTKRARSQHMHYTRNRHSYPYVYHVTKIMRERTGGTEFLAILVVFLWLLVSDKLLRSRWCSFLAQQPPPPWAMANSFTRFLDHTQRLTTVGRTPLDDWSARRKDLYLTTLTTNIHSPGGIRTHSLCRRAAADLRLRQRDHWDR
jgi:hypothetical protein